MEKPKNSLYDVIMGALGDFLGALIDVLAELWIRASRDWFSFAFGILMAGVGVLFIFNGIFGIIALGDYLIKENRPSDVKFALYTEFYNECVDAGVYYTYCEKSAADWAGLESPSELAE